MSQKPRCHRRPTRGRVHGYHRELHDRGPGSTGNISRMKALPGKPVIHSHADHQEITAEIDLRGVTPEAVAKPCLHRAPLPTGETGIADVKGCQENQTLVYRRIFPPDEGRNDQSREGHDIQHLNNEKTGIGVRQGELQPVDADSRRRADHDHQRRKCRTGDPEPSMQTQLARADQQDLSGQQRQPTYEDDGVDVDDGRVCRSVGSEVFGNLGAKAAEDASQIRAT
jgi:hypothetical protein